MKSICINIEDEDLGLFLEALKEFIKDNNLSSDELNISGLSIEEYEILMKKEGLI